MEKLDIFVVAYAKDIKLLRHFLLSYELFFKSDGKIHLFVSKRERMLLNEIRQPRNLIVHWKEDVPGLAADDGRNQMYLKLISDQFVETEWYWVVDADYVICAPLSASEFFSPDKPNWFYRRWLPINERALRRGSEELLGERIPYSFMEEHQFLLNRNILSDLRKRCDVKRILRWDPIPSEFIVYGSFAYHYRNQDYCWINIDESAVAPIAAAQRPPECQPLDPNINLAYVQNRKYMAFWSHWEMAEEKMREFLTAAQMKWFGKVVEVPSETSLPVIRPRLDQRWLRKIERRQRKISRLWREASGR